jgi:hypothetical protein
MVAVAEAAASEAAWWQHAAAGGRSQGGSLLQQPFRGASACQPGAAACCQLLGWREPATTCWRVVRTPACRGACASELRPRGVLSTGAAAAAARAAVVAVRCGTVCASMGRPADQHPHERGQQTRGCAEARRVCARERASGKWEASGGGAEELVKVDRSSKHRLRWRFSASRRVRRPA